jgi:uncharacterized protein YecE (DUF72 family)
VAGTALTTARIGTAGWALPKALRVSQDDDKSVLQQYAELFDAVEINSSFYRPHRRATYERWRAAVPRSFRFSVKMSRTITHELGLVRCRSETASFMETVRGLDDKLAVLLVQLPRSRTFEKSVAAAFFKALRRETAAQIVCEARSPGWFTKAATAVLEEYGTIRAVADPVPSGCEWDAPAQPPFAYFRLHGSPRMYYSAYSLDDLRGVAAAARARQTWCIFDNTAAGAAWSDATALQRLLAASAASPG